jgi:hypothetical protein
LLLEPEWQTEMTTEHTDLSNDEEQVRQRFLRGLCKHVVCLNGVAAPLDQHGKRTDKKIFYSFSGFVVSLRGLWLWITAGHVLQQLDAQIARGEVELLHCNLADYYGHEHDVGTGIPFNYLETLKSTVDNATLGQDIAIVPLRLHYRRLLEMSGIVPLPQDGWDLCEPFECDAYGILGFPEELHSHERKIHVTGGTIYGGVRPVLLTGKASDAKPRSRPEPEHPWLAIALSNEPTVKSIVGMSGGPIFGFKFRPNQSPLYGVLAVQSFWDKERRIAFGTRLDVVMSMFEKEIDTVLARREAEEVGS